MSRNGNGVYISPINSWNPQVDGFLASGPDFNVQLRDIANALTQSVSSDGQTPIVGNLNMGGNKITNLAAGNNAGDSLQWQQLFAQGVERDIASASVVDIGGQNTCFLRVTGMSTITSFGTNYNGPRYLRFSDSLTLTNSSSLITWTGGNVVTVSGTEILAYPKASSGTPDGWVLYPLNQTNLRSINSGQLSGFRNKLMNAAGIINQRNYISGTNTATANQFTLDRWKIVNSGQNLTFLANGNGNVFIAPSGGIEQVIEGATIVGGIYTLSWTGTATALVNGSSITNGGQTASLPANTNVTVRFSAGTFYKPMFELGTQPSVFEERDPGQELELCQKFYEESPNYLFGRIAAPTDVHFWWTFKVSKRVIPFISLLKPSFSGAIPNTIVQNCTGAFLNNNGQDLDHISLDMGGTFSTPAGMAIGDFYELNTKGVFAASADL